MNHHRYTVTTHPSGCKIIEGDACPVSDFSALCAAWAKAGEPDDEILCSTDLARVMTRSSGVNVVAVVGRKSQLAALSAEIGV